MNRETFWEHIIYGDINHVSEIIKIYEESGDTVLNTNGIQGECAINFLELLMAFKGIDVFLDVDNGRADTIFITFGDISNNDIKLLMQHIFAYNPDEFIFNENLNCLRIWWD